MAPGLDFGHNFGVDLQPSVIPSPLSLFEIVADKSIIVAEAWNHLDDRGSWNLNCVRAFND